MSITALPLDETLPEEGEAGNLQRQRDLAHYMNLTTAIVANVKQYGATGDGTTDDTAAINAAVAAIPLAGGLLSFPPGTYKVSDVIDLRSNITIQGAGDSSTSIVQSNTAKNLFAGVDMAFLTIHDIRLVGPGSGSGVGLSLLRSVAAATLYLSLKNVYIRAFGSDGMEISNGIVSTFERVICESNGGHGFNIHGVASGAAGTSCSFSACYANANGLSGYYINNMAYTSLLACAADSQAISYEVVNSQAIGFFACGSESSPNSWKISGNGTYGIGLHNCWSYDNQGKAVWITGNAHTVIVDSLSENTPNSASSVRCVVVDAGVTGVTMLSVNNTSPNSIADSTTTVLNDTGGGAVFPGGIVVNGNSKVTGSLQLTSQLVFGAASDTNLYRVAAGFMGTDSALAVGGLLHTYDNIQIDGGQVHTGSGIDLSLLPDTGVTKINGAIHMSSDAVANLYRVGAGALGTDGSLAVGALLHGYGNISLDGVLIQTNGNAPATATSPGTKGQLGWDNTHLYVCIATNSWTRVAMAAW